MMFPLLLLLTASTVSCLLLAAGTSSIEAAPATGPTPPAGVADEKTNEGIRILKIYQAELSPEQFDHVVDLYRNESASNLERERHVVDYVSRLITSAEQRQRMPLHADFRRFPPQFQQRIRDIYYGQGLTFEQKVFQIGLLVQQLPESQRKVITGENSALKNVNNEPETGLIQFEVNVTTQYKGFFEKERLGDVLTADERAKLQRILDQKGPTNQEKARQLGALLRRAYQRDPEAALRRWPGMFGTAQSLTDTQRRAVNHVMFSGGDPTAQPGPPLIELARQMVADNLEKQHQQLVVLGNSATGGGGQQPQPQPEQQRQLQQHPAPKPSQSSPFAY